MDPESHHRIGKLGRTWGHLGELRLHLEAMSPEEIEDHGSLFVDIEGQQVPFFFTSIREHGREGTLIKFDEIDDPQAAAFLVGREVYVPPGLLTDGSDESWDPESLVGLLVVDREAGEVGEVNALDGTKRNPLLVVQHGEEEVLIPLADDLIEGIDAEEGILLVKLPPGLLDLNRGT